MRRLLYFVVALLFVATGIQAQKIDARLTNLLSDANGVSKTKSAVRGQQQETDTAAVKLVGTTAINMVGADGPRHATPATMYDVDDNCYNTLGQRVSKNAKGLIIYKGRAYFNN